MNVGRVAADEYHSLQGGLRFILRAGIPPRLIRLG